jgi:hypothetical protein
MALECANSQYVPSDTGGSVQEDDDYEIWDNILDIPGFPSWLPPTEQPFTTDNRPFIRDLYPWVHDTALSDEDPPYGMEFNRAFEAWIQNQPTDMFSIAQQK